MSRALLYPIPDWPALRVACVVLSSVRPGKSPIERPLPNLVVELCSPLFLQDCVAVNSQDVVHAATSQTLSEEGEFRLRVLAELDAFEHCSHDICLAQEQVRDEPTRPNSDSECDVTISDCRGFGQAPHIADSPLALPPARSRSK